MRWPSPHRNPREVAAARARTGPLRGRASERYMAVSINWGSFCGVLVVRALLFRSILSPRDFWKLPYKLPVGGWSSVLYPWPPPQDLLFRMLEPIIKHLRFDLLRESKYLSAEYGVPSPSHMKTSIYRNARSS